MKMYLVDFYTHTVLDESGRPRKPESVNHGVRREYLDGLDFISMMRDGHALDVPIKRVRMWERFRALIERVTYFTDGVLLYLKPLQGGIYNADPEDPHCWKRVYFWVANEGLSGVL